MEVFIQPESALDRNRGGGIPSPEGPNMAVCTALSFSTLSNRVFVKLNFVQLCF